MPAVHPRTFREIRRVLIDVVLLDGEQDSAPSLADMAARAKALLGKTEPRKHTVKVPPPAGARGTGPARKEAHRRETARVRAAVVERAGGVCECGCGATFGSYWFNRGELDHYRGGAHRKASTTVEGCWLLFPDCHASKTENRPAALYWRKKWEAHCARHGYDPDGAR